MKKTLCSIVVLSLLIPALVFSNGMNLNNAGTKAIGMGGAFVGLADDYSAVYYNPAGLTQIEGTSVNLFAIDLIPKATYKNSTFGIDTQTKSNHYLSGAFAIFMDLGEKMKVGLYANVPSGLGAEWDGADLKNLSGPAQTAFEWMSKIGVVNFGPAVAYDVTEKLSLGLTVNISYGTMDLKKPEDLMNGMAPGKDGYVDAQYSENSTGMGYGLTVGALFKATEKLSVGASLRTKNTVKFSGDAEIPLLTLLQYPNKSEFDRDITFPIWIGAGVAFKATDKLTLTADVQMTQWEDTHQELVTEYKNAIWNQLFTASGADKLELKWKNTTSIRIGGMYALTPCLDLMAGFYLDPTPGVNETANILLPEISNNVITVGIGWAKGPLSLQFAFEYLMGKENDVTKMTADNMPGIHNMTIPVPNLAVSYQL